MIVKLIKVFKNSMTLMTTTIKMMFSLKIRTICKRKKLKEKEKMEEKMIKRTLYNLKIYTKIVMKMRQ